ncbi:hypothetical protein ABT246_24475 [Streptomyces sp. NPDC001553]
MTPCTVVETETEPCDHGIKHTDYVVIRDMGGERRRVSSELVSIEPSEA